MPLKKLFQTKRVLEVDLQMNSLKEILDFPSWDMEGIQIIDLKDEIDMSDVLDITQTVDDQTICLQVAGESRFPDTKHYLQYFPKDKQVIIKSKYTKAPWIYLYVLLPLMPLFFGDESKSLYVFIALAFVTFLFVSCFLYFGIQGKTKTIERELIIRINYNRRHGNHKNPK